jgi:hypothetical protein
MRVSVNVLVRGGRVVGECLSAPSVEERVEATHLILELAKTLWFLAHLIE